MPNGSIGVTQHDYMRRLLPHIARKRPYFSMKNPDYRLPLPPISQCRQKEIVTIQASYQAKSQDNNHFHDMRFLQDPRYYGNIMTFKKHVRLFPETRTCFFKKTYVFIFKSVSLLNGMSMDHLFNQPIGRELKVPGRVRERF